MKASTTYYHFKKPTVGGSNGIYGFEINQIITDADSVLYDRYNQLLDRRYINHVINPCFIVNQRYGLATQTSIADNQKFSDMWIFHREGTNVSGYMCYNQQTDLMYQTGYNNASSYGGRFKVTTAQATASITASTTFYIENTIEGLNYQSLAWQDYVTVSFYVKCNKTGTYCVSLMNQDKNRSYIYEYSINSTDWEKKSFTFSPDLNTLWNETTTNGLDVKSHLRINFTFAAGSTLQETSGAWVPGKKLSTSNQTNLMDTTTNIIQFTQLKVEGGEHANVFSQRTVFDELNLCQRYYETSNDFNTSTSTGNGAIGGLAQVITASTTAIAWSIRFKNRKRDIPSTYVYGIFGGGADTADNSTYPLIAVVTSNICQSGFVVTKDDPADTVTCLYMFRWVADASLS